MLLRDFKSATTWNLRHILKRHRTCFRSKKANFKNKIFPYSSNDSNMTAKSASVGRSLFGLFFDFSPLCSRFKPICNWQRPHIRDVNNCQTIIRNSYNCDRWMLSLKCEIKKCFDYINHCNGRPKLKTNYDKSLIRKAS